MKRKIIDNEKKKITSFYGYPDGLRILPRIDLKTYNKRYNLKDLDTLNLSNSLGKLETPESKKNKEHTLASNSQIKGSDIGKKINNSEISIITKILEDDKKSPEEIEKYLRNAFIKKSGMHDSFARSRDIICEVFTTNDEGFIDESQGVYLTKEIIKDV